MFKVSSERLEKPGIEPTTPGLQGDKLYLYTTEASYLEYNHYGQSKGNQPHCDYMPMQYTLIFNGCKNDDFQIEKGNIVFIFV